MGHKLVFNIERVGRKTLLAQKKHDLREWGNLSHTDPKAKSLNFVLHGSGDCVQDVDTLMETKSVKVRKDNEKPYTRIVISASPELFEDTKKSKEWINNSLGFLRETWGDGFVYAVLHMDETTPHIHAVVVPVVETKRGLISSHHTHPATKGLNSFARLRKTASDRLGLEYGEQGNKPQTKAEREAKEILSRTNAVAFHRLDQVDAEYETVRTLRQNLEDDRDVVFKQFEALEKQRQALQREQEAHNRRALTLHHEAVRLKDLEVAARAKDLVARPCSEPIRLPHPEPARKRSRHRHRDEIR